jgi:hypothetical protein
MQVEEPFGGGKPAVAFVSDDRSDRSQTPWLFQALHPTRARSIPTLIANPAASESAEPGFS